MVLPTIDFVGPVFRALVIEVTGFIFFKIIFDGINRLCGLGQRNVFTAGRHHHAPLESLGQRQLSLLSIEEEDAVATSDGNPRRFEARLQGKERGSEAPAVAPLGAAA